MLPRLILFVMLTSKFRAPLYPRLNPVGSLNVGVYQSQPLKAGIWISVSLRRGLINYCATIPTILTVIGSPGISPILVSSYHNEVR